MKRICFDIGGTFIKWAIFENENIIIKDKISTPKGDAKKLIIDELCIIIGNNRNGLSSIGIATAGMVDVENKLISFASDTIPNYTGCDFKVLQEQFNINVEVLNDVDAAVVGETTLYSQNNTLVMLTIGTGIGGAFYYNGDLLKSKNHGVMDIGHMKISRVGPICSCGKQGCFESFASMTALLKQYFELTGSQITGETLIKNYENCDINALQIMDKFFDNVSFAISNLIYIIDPDYIIIGGGISSNEDIINKGIEKNIVKYVGDNVRIRNRIVCAKLRNDASLFGMNKILQN